MLSMFAIGLLLSCSHALAASGDFLNAVTINANSQNVFTIDQAATGHATQSAEGIFNAVTNLSVTQAFAPQISVTIDQHCSEDQLCLEQASPVVSAIATQAITASATNFLTVAQNAVSGSQAATLSGSATTILAAQQILTPEVTMTIAQDCSISAGACVQSALPVVEALASQIIDASAKNAFVTAQQMESGSLQTADLRAAAATNVQAEQIVTATAVFSLVQTCKVDTGLCLQDASPLLRALAEQVVRVQAENLLVLTQSGALDQTALATGSASTLVDVVQDTVTDLTVTVVQQCDVKKGLCIQSQNGLQQYVFSDGETIEAGEYLGTLDEHALDAGFNRQTVATVAMGICPLGTGLCPHVQQLLVWLFGAPEPESVQSEEFTPPVSVPQPDNHDSVRRGHATNMIGGFIRFFEKTLRNTSNDPVVALITDADSGLDTRTLSLVCQVRRNMQEKKSPDLRMRRDMRIWAAGQIAQSTGVDQALIEKALVDPTLCTEATTLVQEKPATAPAIAFPIDMTGPLSSNTLWNDCVRGKYVTYDEIRANPDRDPRTNRPRSCGNYHTQNNWYHPDLGMRFTWDPATHMLVLPTGFVAIPQRQQVAVEEDVTF